MSASPLSPELVTATPIVQNFGNQLWVVLPVSNIGTAVASSLTMTSVALGSIALISPGSFPVVAGNLGLSQTIPFQAIFNGSALAAGQRELLTLRGTYTVSSTTLGFALNRLVTVPTATASPVTLLSAQIATSTSGSTWSYELKNNEPADSALFISAVTIDVTAPFSVASTPAGWSVDTDNATYVLWYTDNLTAQIAPGASKSGFSIKSSALNSQSTKVVIASWDHVALTAGAVWFDRALTPAN